jgi:hypothetical protein
MINFHRVYILFYVMLCLEKYLFFFFLIIINVEIFVFDDVNDGLYKLDLFIYREKKKKNSIFEKDIYLLLYFFFLKKKIKKS